MTDIDERTFVKITSSITEEVMSSFFSVHSCKELKIVR